VARTPGISAKQVELLGRLKRTPALRGFSLVGGTAIASLFEHRHSHDLDLFASKELDAAMHALVRAGAMVRVQTEVMVGLVFDGVDIDLVRYPYPLLTPPTPGPGGFPRAGVMDLAVMKLAAIGRRGLRRDFWDLFVLLEGGGLTIEQVVKAYRKRYRTSASDGYHLIRALAYFEDAERDDPRVIGLSLARWQTIRSFFEAESARLLGR
jgi:hypothetical protein